MKVCLFKSVVSQVVWPESRVHTVQSMVVFEGVEVLWRVSFEVVFPVDILVEFS